ncbi:hypothetical protein HF690_01100 [Oleiagrimonas citrea]|uniref:Uncharacterized protein n=1 Tax=Oleiagrimonas citrea TaxID=1665687 RepID=A0A846ZFS2_9GAMM|nr:hypothetical protein [Oleiagrimonas citrea]NKZ37546.1 hypothetical protein [Oleiagrimonas citrea]
MSMDAARFTFEALDQRFQTLGSARDEPKQSMLLTRWGASLLLVGSVIGYGAATFLHSMPALVLSITGLVIEMLGACALFLQFLRYEWHQIRHPLRNDARELDTIFEQGMPVLAWLCRFPAQELERHLRFVRDRTTTFNQSMSWMFGPIDRLGPLPVLVALYLQFKDVRTWWPVRTDPVHAALALLLIFLYLFGSVIVIQRMRRQRYVNWLSEALIRKREAGQDDSSQNPSTTESTQ